MNKINDTMPLQDGYIALADLDIEAELRLHPYDPNRLQNVYDVLDEEIRNFDPLPKNDETSLPFAGRVKQSYGEYLEDHLVWTSETLKNFLRHLDYEEEIAAKVAQAFKRHDTGKTQMPGQWKITEEKQNFSDDQRMERTRLHCVLGAQRIQTEVEESAGDRTSFEDMGFKIAKHMALFHHERLNGSGPFGLQATEICPILRAATIVDTFHGKLKSGKNAEQICDEMASDKHKGEFDLNMLKAFKNFLQSFAPEPSKGMRLQP